LTERFLIYILFYENTKELKNKEGCGFILKTFFRDNALSHNSSIPTFTVNIFPSENGGYWAECPMVNGAAFTDGGTIKETEVNMYESVALFLRDDFPDVTDFSLEFFMADE
jgi:predicted RNase H-like HicB family nuclease